MPLPAPKRGGGDVLDGAGPVVRPVVGSRGVDDAPPPHPPRSSAATARPTPRSARPMPPMMRPRRGRRRDDPAVTVGRVAGEFQVAGLGVRGNARYRRFVP